jgi:glycerophosphoryl diester phosphodiesterase
MSARRVIHLVAHRGNAYDCPENTLPALRSALDLGVRFLEIDVQLSADAVPVVLHDHSLARTAGVDRSVFDLNASEIVEIEAAERARFGARFAGTRVPLLRDALAILVGRPEITFFIEIKRASLARFGHEQVIQSLLEAIAPHRSQCVLVSFDLPAIYRARQISGCRIGWVLPAYDNHTRLKFEALQPEFLFCDQTKLPPGGSLWRGPWRWAVYEIMTLDSAVSLARRGADFIETMSVRAMSQAMRAHAVRTA